MTLTTHQALPLYFKLGNRPEHYVNIMCLFILRVIKGGKPVDFKITFASCSLIIIFLMFLGTQESFFS